MNNLRDQDIKSNGILFGQRNNKFINGHIKFEEIVYWQNIYSGPTVDQVLLWATSIRHELLNKIFNDLKFRAFNFTGIKRYLSLYSYSECGDVYVEGIYLRVIYILITLLKIRVYEVSKFVPTPY